MTQIPQRRQGVKADSRPDFPLQLLEPLLSMRFDLELALRNFQGKYPHGLPQSLRETLERDFIESRSGEILSSIFPAFFARDVDEYRTIACLALDSNYMILSLLCDSSPEIRKIGIKTSRFLIERMLSILGMVLVLQKDQEVDVAEQAKKSLGSLPATKSAFSAMLSANPKLWQEVFSEAENLNTFAQNFLGNVEL